MKANLENRITSLNMEDYIHEVIVPTEEVAEIKNGQRKLVKRTVPPRLRPGPHGPHRRVLVAVRHTPSVTGFVGHSHQPVPLSLDEVESMLAPAIAAEVEAAPPPRAGVAGGRHQEEGRGRRLRRPTRSWWSTARSPRCTRRSPRSTPSPRVKALVEIFGRETPVELSFSQIQKVEAGSGPSVSKPSTTKHQAPTRKPVGTTREKETSHASQEEDRCARQGAAAGRGGTSAPPVGTALGPHGVNIMEFCKAYNAQTEAMRGNVIPVEITIYEDRVHLHHQDAAGG